MDAPDPVLTQPWSAPIIPRAPAPELQNRLKTAFGVAPAFTEFIGPLEWFHDLCFWSMIASPQRVPARWADVAKFVTSQENCCRVCYGAQRAYMQVIGYDLAWIQRLERSMQTASLDPAEQAVADFARKLARSNPRPAVRELQVLLDLGVTREQAAELAAIVGVSCVGNRLSTFLAVPPDHALERLADSWWAAPLRRIARRRIRNLAVPPPAPTPVDGAFAEVLAPLGHLQWGGIVRRCLDGALAPAALSRRTKLLMVDVIAHALGCAVCIHEAERALAAEGMTAAQVSEVVQRLGGAGLSREDEELLIFARETVRYDPKTIQRRVQQLAEAVGPESTREAVALAAVANMLVRIGMFTGC